MSKASIICVTLGRTESLVWEINRIDESGYLGKTIFVLPPTDREEHIERLAVLAEVLELNWADLDVSPTGGWALAIRVPAKGAVPEIIRARAQEDVAYDIALEVMRLRLRGWAWETPTPLKEYQLQAPRAQIHQIGQAPKAQKALWRQPWMVLLMINITGLAAVPLVFLTGVDANENATLDLGAVSAWDVAADTHTDDMYAIVDGNGVYRVVLKGGDHPKLEAHRVAIIDTAVFLEADEDWLIATNHVKGTMQGIAPGSDEASWKRDDLPGIHRVASQGGILYAAIPSKRLILAIDRLTGKDIAAAKVGGIPWAVAISGDRVAVAFADKDDVELLSLADLQEKGKYDTSSPSTVVVAANGSLWVYHPSEHSLQAVSGSNSGNRIATRSESPVFASNGNVMAIGGVEIVSTLRPTGMLHRNRYSLRHPEAMAVTKSGDVLSATDNKLVFIRASSG